MTLLEQAAMRRAQDAIRFAFAPPMRADLLAEAGVAPDALTIDKSPDEKLHILVPIDDLKPQQVIALLLTTVQGLYDSMEQQA